MRTGFQKAPDCCRTSAFCSFRGTFVFGPPALAQKTICPVPRSCNLPRGGSIMRRFHVSRFSCYANHFEGGSPKA
ncbi:hypothetical protein WV34_16085 [Bacillus amyloliquefaciens]|nr:hypothetical protein WV34_16085 [Bacillus amyloliquefaciens]